MTQEQKDWYEYGIKKYFYLALKVMNDPQYRILAQRAWDARKKAYRWLDKGNCEKCRYFHYNYDGCMDCGECNWEPKD